MKTKKTIKQAKKTTCNVLIRNYPGEVADQVKALTGEKTLSKALISVSRMYIEIKKEHEKLKVEHVDLQERAINVQEGICKFWDAFQNLGQMFKEDGKGK